jgi:hypothetical protein
LIFLEPWLRAKTVFMIFQSLLAIYRQKDDFTKVAMDCHFVIVMSQNFTTILVWPSASAENSFEFV